MARLLPALALLLAACAPAADTRPPLAGAALGGPFTLVGEDGGTVTDADFKGRYRLMYFGYTTCPDVCPTSLARLMAGYRDLEESHPDVAAKVQPIFVTVDPERDTPAVMKQYTDGFDPHLLGLTGTPDAIARVTKAYGVGATREEVEGSSEYLMTHSDLAILYGPDGQPITAIQKSEDVPPAAIAEEIARWVT